MGFINVAERTINAKLVYYGVGVGGKTTSLQRVHGILCPRNEVQLVSINTEEDSTLLFDFLPINLGSVGGFKVRIQGFTVPGQPKYRQMRKYVLAGADAVVFVVDSQKSRLQENLESLQSMRDNLKAATAAEIPIVVQYNKRDLPDILSERELDKHFRFRPDIEAFPSVATEGQGVFEAFVHAAGLLVASKVRQYGLHRGRVQPDEVADGARKKLWEICDQIRRERGEVTTGALPLTKLSIPDGGPSPKAPAASPSTPSAPAAPAATAAAPVVLPPPAPPSPTTGEVISDAELDIDFGRQPVSFAAETPAAEEDEQLLDRSVQSNLELVQRYGQLDEHKNLLERKVRELVEVAQNTVHDLNRPVSALRLMLSAVEKGLFGELPTGCEQAVQNGLLAVQQMERLIRDLLDSSRLDHDGVTLKFESVDLTLLLAQVINTLRFEIQHTDAHVRLEPLPVVQADEWALSKVFNNLVGNALQYAKEGRRLVVRIWAEEHADEWRISVRDNGIGIPAKDRDRLFRRFERGSNTGGISGNGLGLHIIKEIAQGHGGCVTFDSTEGEGTTFVVHLPKVPVQAPHSPLTETAARADL
jgi:signal transduction histidine kinase/signal recognition particle receptor subunit beta